MMSSTVSQPHGVSDRTDITLKRVQSRVVVEVGLPDSLDVFSPEESQRRCEKAMSRVQDAVIAYLRSGRTLPLVLSVRV